MAITRRGTPTTNALLAGAQTVSISVPAGVADGDLLLCWAVFGDAITNYAISGWTQLESPVGTNCRGHLFYRVASSEPSSHSATWTTNAKCTISMVAYAGVDTGTPIAPAEHASAGETSARTIHTTPSVTPGAADRWAVACFGDRSTNVAAKNTNWGAGAGISEIVDANNNSAATSPWLSQGVSDSNGTVTQAAHAYTGTSQISQVNAVMALVMLTPATESTAKDDADTGEGIDAASLTAVLDSADSASGVDAQALAAAASTTDAGAVSDAESLTASPSSTDSSAAADAETLATSIPAGDSGTALEAASISATLTAGDTAAGVDAAAVTALLATADAGTAADQELLAVNHTAADTGTSTEAASLAVDLDATDVGAVVDAATLFAALAASDAVAAAEDAWIALAAADAATGADSALLTALAAHADVGQAVEDAFVQVFVADGDTILSLDQAGVTIPVFSSDTGSFSETASVIELQSEVTLTVGSPTRGWSSGSPSTVWSASTPTRGWASSPPTT